MTTPIRHHIPPPPGEPQPLTTATPLSGPVPTVAATNGILTLGGRLFAPLAGLDPNNVLQGGYNWLSLTDGGNTLHPGLDLNAGGSCNADQGNPVVAMLRGIVRAVCWWDGVQPGEGNHVWYELADSCSPGPTYVHHDHLATIEVVAGQVLSPGQRIGTCGRSGGWDCAHLHTEWSRGSPAGGYWQWPYGWSRAQVEAAYHNPWDWWAVAKENVAHELAGNGGALAMEPVLTDWELTNWVLSDLYQWANIPFDPNSGMAKTWVSALHAGVYAGRPRTAERPFGTGAGAGVWAEFDHRILIYENDGRMSWNG